MPYVGIVLDQLSKKRLEACLQAPSNAEILLHHCTLVPPTKFSRFVGKSGRLGGIGCDIGDTVLFDVRGMAVDASNSVCALHVSLPSGISSEQEGCPHVTAWVDREKGGKPYHSTRFGPGDYRSLPLPIFVEGVVTICE